MSACCCLLALSIWHAVLLKMTYLGSDNSPDYDAVVIGAGFARIGHAAAAAR